jgi:myosin-5
MCISTISLKSTYIQTDLEEAKTQELSKLQSSIDALQAKLDETNAVLAKEREAAKKAIEEAPPVVKETEVLVQDTEKVASLEAEVDELKVWNLLDKQYCYDQNFMDNNFAKR